MFRGIRRKEKEIQGEQVLEILKNGEYGIFSTVSNSGYPYVIPVNYVYTNDTIYFHCALEGHKLDNITYNNKVSFCVVGDTYILSDKFSTNYDSIIVFGKATEAFDEEKNTALIKLLEKYSSDYMDKGKIYIKNAGDKTKVIKISIDYVSGKSGK
ncbi:pyridoxamine 5'-phosphate oxidase family protein [Romboutsia weinsteinii]|uniref:Pyridoxamine 5'-phosphate oxidase family protein n=1 Tax=Romboutsia weinsteinii TaxID=2020949 RepID=A0A371J580_9FIRM|nr:pyridoxamine 5'-phosphate oxidase family protein [Romboutsia weinsteinii]RDY27895.1 pyridoxamine 5'-phosphate oxidase family protein [Romboutsia weinsteinii]